MRQIGTFLQIVWLRRPIVWVALAQIVGLFCANIEVSPYRELNIGLTTSGILLGYTFVAVIMAAPLSIATLPKVSEYTRHLIVAILLTSASFCWGLYSYTTAFTIIYPNDIRFAMQDSQVRMGTIRGEMLERPIVHSIFTRTEDGTRHQDTWKAKVRIKGIRWEQEKTFVPIHGIVLLKCSGEPFLTAGERFEMEGILQRPKDSGSSIGFNYGKYLENQGIFFEFSVSKDSYYRNYGVSPHWLSKLRYTAANFRSWASDRLTLGTVPNNAYNGMYQAITIGERVAMDDRMKLTFQHTGILHLVAISGYNIGIIALMLLAFLRVVCASPFLRAVITIPSLIFYTMMVGADPPVVRATVMSCILLFGTLVARPSDARNSLGLAAFLMLSYDPLQFFQPSFQLSFALVLSLSLLMPSISKIYQLYCARMILCTMFGKICHTLLLLLLADIVSSGIGWISTLPLSVAYFQLLPLSSAIVNCIVVPLAFPLQGLAMISIFMASWIPAVSSCCNQCAEFLLMIIDVGCSLMEKIPYSYVYIPSWSWWTWGVYYVGLVGIMSGFFLRKSLLPVTTGYFICVIAAICSVKTTNADGQGSNLVYITGANQGSAILIRDAHSKKISLIDTGSPNVARHIIAPFLKQTLHQNKIDTLFLTHGDAEHIRGAVTLCGQMQVEQVYVNPLRTRSPYLKQWQSQLPPDDEPPASQEPPVVRAASAGLTIDAFQVLYPDPVLDRDLTRADQQAVVLLLKLDGRRFLFISDLDADGQERLMNRAAEYGFSLECDVLVCGLSPDLPYPYASGFIEKCNPEQIVLDGVSQAQVENIQQKLRNHHLAIEVLYRLSNPEPSNKDGQNHTSISFEF